MISQATDPASVITEVAARFGVEPRVRRFGSEVGDLDVDFDAPRPIAITRLLVGCAGGDADAWWRAPVRARIVALVAIGEIVGPIIEARIECSCGEVASVALTAAELLAFDRERIATAIDVEGVRVRIPTGRDQLHWIGIGAPGESAARRVISALLESGGDAELDDARIVAIEHALADADPLVDFHVDSACPACGAVLRADVDLEGLALFRLKRAQHALITQIHALARAYHWSEREIVQLPAWRRDEYLALIEARA